MVVSRSRPLAAVAGDNTIDVGRERRREPRREVRRGRQKPERCVGGLKRRNLNDALAEKGERCVGGPHLGMDAIPPIVDEWQTRDHLSVMGGVTPQGKVSSLVRPTSLNGLHTIEFLVHLGRLGADRLLVVWDGSPIHRRAEVKAFVAEAGDAIHLEPLPPYAPDLNPVEWLWRQMKEVEMRNQTCLDLEQLHMELHRALDRGFFRF